MQDVALVDFVDGILEPHIARLESVELAQRALDAPGGALAAPLPRRVHIACERVVVARGDAQPAGVQHLGQRAQYVPRLVLAPARAGLIQAAGADLYARLVFCGDAHCLGHVQLEQVDHRVGIAREHAGAGGAVHAALAALAAL